MRQVDSDDDEPAQKRRAGIQSVEIGLGVLDALAGLGKPSTLSAVVQACGLSPSQTHRYLASLVVANMARQDSNGNYDLGSGALRLGLRALAQTDVFQFADATLADFARESGRSIQMAALGPSGPTIVRYHAGSPPVVMSLQVGSRLSLLHSATGRTFLAFVPEAETRALVEQEMKAGKGLKAIDVQQMRERIRAAGYAAVDGTVTPGLRALALPIVDLQGRAVLSATMIASDVFATDHDAEAARALLERCTEISSHIGGKQPPAPGL